VQFREFISHGNIEHASSAATATNHKMIKKGFDSIKLKLRNKNQKKKKTFFLPLHESNNNKLIQNYMNNNIDTN
jgi:hypothetical protein